MNFSQIPDPTLVGEIFIHYLQSIGYRYVIVLKQGLLLRLAPEQQEVNKLCHISMWGDALGLQYEALPYINFFLIIPLKATIFENFSFTI
jgi:hypothetical protein